MGKDCNHLNSQVVDDKTTTGTGVVVRCKDCGYEYVRSSDITGRSRDIVYFEGDEDGDI